MGYLSSSGERSRAYVRHLNFLSNSTLGILITAGCYITLSWSTSNEFWVPAGTQIPPSVMGTPVGYLKHWFTYGFTKSGFGHRNNRHLSNNSMGLATDSWGRWNEKRWIISFPSRVRAGEGSLVVSYEHRTN